MKIIKIGKSDTNDIYKIFVNDITVSKEHCQIFIDDEGNKFLTDLNSTNGTFVNNNKISEPVILTQYDIVRAGNSLVNWKEFLHNQNERTSNGSLLKAENIISKTEVDSETNIDGKFNNKNPKYRSIKITNICLLILSIFLEMFAAAEGGVRFSPLAPLITFWIARTIIRMIFTKNPDFNYKIIITIAVYMGTFIIKTVILLSILKSML
jgi:uncharacterized protein YneF (UPF0154 family)